MTHGKQLLSSVVFFILFAGIAIGVGATYNFIDSEITKYQARQIEKKVAAEEEYRRQLTGLEVLNVKSLIIGEVDESGEVRTRFTRGENIPFTFCREPLINVIAGTNVRSYYKTVDGVEIQSRQRALPEGILYENTTNNCPELNLFADNLPKTDGVYSFCQTVQFDAWGYMKDATYCSDNKFEIKEN